MKEICFATNNPNKLKEISQQLEGKFKVLGLKDIGCTEEIPEEQPTLEGNSQQKAAYIWDKYKVNCFADDTGLEVEALGGAPGVYSARYAGPQRNSEDNMALVLDNLKDKENRKAEFKTIITLVIDGVYEQFEGKVEGHITHTKTGEEGFGYDPIFQPLGYDKTFAQMSTSEKNEISHRGRAVKKLISFLRKY